MVAIKLVCELTGALDSFMYALKSPDTQRQYPIRLRIFFNFLQVQGDTVEEQAVVFLDKVIIKREWSAEDCLIRFITYNKQRVADGTLAAGTLSNYAMIVKLFYEMNNIIINWKRISRGLPKSRIVASDRAPSIEEIQTLVQYPDRRIKPLVYTMFSSGIRLGAWNYLKWKHIVPIPNGNGVAKIIVYAGEPEEYYSFISAEAYNALKE